MHIAEEKLRACITSHIDTDPGSVRLEPITTGKFNSSFYVSAGSGRYVLRIAPSDNAFLLFYEKRMMRQEPGIHRLLLENTSVPVPRIHVYDDTRSIVPGDFLIMERLPGRAMSEAWGTDTSAVLKQVGECLAQVHAQTADTYGYTGEHRPMEPQETWMDAFAIMWNRLLDDVAATGQYTDGETLLMRKLLDEHIDCFSHPVTSRLLHMDVWAQNIMVDEQSRLTGLVDWDRALWGDVEIEFAVLDYCGISEPPFWEGYGERRDLSGEAQVRRVFYLLYELQKYIPIRHFRGGDPSSARTYKQQALDIVRRTFRV
jgi:aminoglycoside phosphotransferase (APT) family kinase protein